MDLKLDGHEHVSQGADNHNVLRHLCSIGDIGLRPFLRRWGFDYAVLYVELVVVCEDLQNSATDHWWNLRPNV